ncbi:MAG: methionine--tRNA ligase [Candidatus Taylorbacteria bacterium]|nr:methionine--tRNA ligase [Candidatus Taylorbacteria bacterium]
MSVKNFYITTTLPYVNSDPHIGFAMEIIRADAIARFHKLQGDNVFFNTGTDEHGLKIYQKAFNLGQNTQDFVDGYAEAFKNLKGILNLSEDLHFVRTTDSRHVEAAQEFWKRCNDNGYIYKKLYQAKYCSGCELEKTDVEIENGHCFIHPNIDLILIDEENYFFKFSEFQKPLLEFYAKHPDFVVPDFRFNEIKAFVERGLQDFSISRLKSKMPWGVPVPGDDGHVMYVWFDALVSYISTLGWPKDTASFEQWWVSTGGVVQYCGKDNLRQQSAMWQAMLMAAGLPNSKQIVINGFITSGGQKMSKSLGNVVSPIDIVNEFGTDALRYYVLREFSPFEDSDFTLEKFKESYNAGLANGLGNLVSRVMKMATTYDVRLPDVALVVDEEKYTKAFESFEINKACQYIWSLIQDADRLIQETEPFKLIKTDPEKAKKIVGDLLSRINFIAVVLRPILPETSKIVEECVTSHTMPEKPLFLRK